MITREKISAVRANSFVIVEQLVFFLVIRNSLNKRPIGGAALIRLRRLLTFLSQMRRFFEGGAYSIAALINFFVPDAALKDVRSKIFCH